MQSRLEKKTKMNKKKKKTQAHGTIWDVCLEIETRKCKARQSAHVMQSNWREWQWFTYWCHLKRLKKSCRKKTVLNLQIYWLNSLFNVLLGPAASAAAHNKRLNVNVLHIFFFVSLYRFIFKNLFFEANPETKRFPFAVQLTRVCNVSAKRLRCGRSRRWRQRWLCK